MTEQQVTRPKAVTAQRPAARSGVSPAVRDAAKETAVGLLKGKAVDVAFGQSSYLKAAFLNPYNLSLLGGAAAASLLTLNPLPILGALGLETLWLLWAPDSKRLRHLLWDPRFVEAQEGARGRGAAQADRGPPGARPGEGRGARLEAGGDRAASRRRTRPSRASSCEPSS